MKEQLEEPVNNWRKKSIELLDEILKKEPGTVQQIIDELNSIPVKESEQNKPVISDWSLGYQAGIVCKQNEIQELKSKISEFIKILENESVDSHNYITIHINEIEKLRDII